MRIITTSAIILSFFFIISCNGSKTESITSESDSTKTSTDIVKQSGNILQSDTSSGKYPADLRAYIPVGYSILDTVKGDLNLDQFPDMIMIIKNDHEDSTSDVNDHPEKRPLMIFTGTSENKLKLAAKNDNTVLCVDCGGVMGDPYNGVTIKDGYFSVEHYGGSSWRWTKIITYKYSPSDKYWYLHKDGSESYHTSDPDKVENDIKTTKDFGKVPFDRFDIYKE